MNLNEATGFNNRAIDSIAVVIFPMGPILGKKLCCIFLEVCPGCWDDYDGKLPHLDHIQMQLVPLRCKQINGHVLEGVALVIVLVVEGNVANTRRVWTSNGQCQSWDSISWRLLWHPLAFLRRHRLAFKHYGSGGPGTEDPLHEMWQQHHHSALDRGPP